MLPYALAIAIGASSLVLFLTAFLMPKIHRQDDFLWSGVGLLYALVLWFCASSIRGAVLLGQLAAVTLLSFYAWEVFTLRKAIADPEAYNIEDRFSVVGFISKFLESSVESVPSETSESQEIPASEAKIADTEEEIPEAQGTIEQEKTPETISETEENSVATMETTLDEDEIEEGIIETTSEIEEDSVASIETELDEAEAETIEIASETELDEAEAETIEITSETELDEAEAETIEIASETEEDSVTTMETELDEAEAETIEIASETEEDSVTTIESKLDAIFQDKDPSEVETHPSATTTTSDLEFSNWEDDLSNSNQDTKLEDSSEDIQTSLSDPKNQTHSHRE